MVTSFGGNTYKSRREKLMKIQSKIVHLITFKNCFEYTEPISQELQILNIYKVNDYLISLFKIGYSICKICLKISQIIS